MIIVLILLFGSPFIVYGFAAWVPLSWHFDTVHANRVSEFGANSEGTLRIYANGKRRFEKLGRSVIITGPYRVDICTSNVIRQNVTLKKASLARVVEGQLIPVEAEFHLDSDWVRDTQDSLLEEYIACVRDILVLDIEVESREYYCIDLTFDLREEEQVERTCLRFLHDAGSSRATILGILGAI